MKTILLLSVGDSAEPIVNAIKNKKPDFVYFFCSSGPRGSEKTIDSPGDPCGDKRKSKCPECDHEYTLGDPKGKAIIFQAGLKREQYEIVTIDDPDDLNGCYLKLQSLATAIKEKFGDCHVLANYPRVDLVKVRSGDVPVVIDKWMIICQNQLDFLKKLLYIYHYAFIANSISEMLSHPLDKALRDKLIEARTVSEAFDLWDKFKHKEALELLEHYGRFYPYIINLKKILGKTGGSGYELVCDLLNNAERRAAQKHFDDAVARLYRAIELFAQIRMEKEYEYKTDDLKLEQLPERLKDEYNCRIRDGKILLGLVEDYELLFKLGDHFGKKFEQNRGRIIDAIKKRNTSISGGHGTTPLAEEDYFFVRDRLKGFIFEAAKEIGVNMEMEQLPRKDVL